MSKEDKKAPEVLFQELMNDNNLAVDVQIKKVRSQDTGLWHDRPLIAVSYKKTK